MKPNITRIVWEEEGPPIQSYQTVTRQRRLSIRLGPTTRIPRLTDNGTGRLYLDTVASAAYHQRRNGGIASDAPNGLTRLE